MAAAQQNPGPERPSRGPLHRSLRAWLLPALLTLSVHAPLLAPWSRPRPPVTRHSSVAIELTDSPPATLDEPGTRRPRPPTSASQPAPRRRTAIAMPGSSKRAEHRPTGARVADAAPHLTAGPGEAAPRAAAGGAAGAGAPLAVAPLRAAEPLAGGGLAPVPPAPGAGAAPAEAGSPALLAYASQLRARVAAQQHYPRSARRTGQRGQCLVRLHIDRRGHLAAAPALLRSSGWPALDAEALRMCRAALPFPAPATRGLGDAGLVIDVPVQFSLDRE
jgi:TonB family protein